MHPSFRAQIAWLLSGFVLAGTAGWAHAQDPSISATSPIAIAPGQTVNMKLKGGNLTGAAGLWTSFAAQAVLADDVKDNGKQAGEVTYRLSTPTDTPVGIYAIRVVTPTGVSGMKLIAVDDLPTVAQQTNNTLPANSQKLTIPCAVDGVLANLSRNYYTFSVTAGQELSFEVLARRLGSPLDPMIRILDARGRELTYSDDVPGLRADARIYHKFAKAGEYSIEIRDIRYQGGGNHFYRLRIGDFPCVTVPYPMGVQRGENATVLFAGSSIANVEPVKLNIPTDAPFAWLNVGAKRAGGTSSAFATLSSGSSSEFVETEPNNEAAAANRVELGANLNGKFQEPNDIDRFVFAAKKGQKYTFTGVTRRQGAPTSLYMRILKPDGNQAAVKEDFGVSDAEIAFTFPEDGDYTLELQDMHRRGGEAFAYRILAQPTVPGFDIAAAADHINVAAGGVASVTVTSKRHGYNGAIEVAVTGLPEGMTSTPTVIGPGQNSVVLTLECAANVPAAKIYSVEVVGSAKIGQTDYRAVATVTDALKGSLSGLPWPPETLAEAVAVGVAPAGSYRLRTEPATLVFGRDLSATVKVIAERGEGFNEEIALAVTPAKGGLPAGITAAVKPIPKDKNEVEIVFSANDKAPLAEFTAVLTGTLTKDKKAIPAVVPGIRLNLQQPFSLTVDAGDAKVKRGAQLKAKVTIQRNPALAGEVTLTAQNLPKGVTVAGVKIPADKNEVEILISAADDATVGAAKDVTIKGEATVGKAKLSAETSKIAITVE